MGFIFEPLEFIIQLECKVEVGIYSAIAISHMTSGVNFWIPVYSKKRSWDSDNFTKFIVKSELPASTLQLKLIWYLGNKNKCLGGTHSSLSL